MSVRAKFQCQGIDHKYQGSASTYCEITMVPVWTGENGENAQWSKATPNGKLTMGITNPAAVEQFELGKSYFIDISPAD